MLTRINRALRARDSGYALLAVIGLGVVMLTLVAITLTSTSSGQRKSYTDSNWNAALTAAYAGLDDYKARLANDGRYVRFGNTNADFDGVGSAGSGRLTLPTGANANPAFDVTAGGTWAAVPGSDGSASFRYEVDDRKYYSTGIISLRSTGKVGNSTRSVIADFRQKGFFDYVYYTTYEVQDPAISGEDARCGQNFAWDRNRLGLSCAVIAFSGDDTLRGDVHSDDRITIGCATFYGAVTSGTQDSAAFSDNGCSTNSNRFRSGAPTKEAGAGIPPTNNQQATETRVDLPDLVPDPGCMYTGPTSITFLANGTMRVISPWTKMTQESFTSGIPSRAWPTTGARNCGTPGTGANGLASATGAIVPVPENNLIYVQKVDPTAGNPNYWAAGAAVKPWGSSLWTCNNSGAATEGFAFGTGSTWFRYPDTARSEGTPLSSSVINPAYSCREGDAYISGELDGRVTVSAGRYAYLVGDMKYTADEALPDDVLGLDAQKAVWVWNPMKNIVDKTGLDNDTATAVLTDSGRTINASILSVTGTFQVQNYHVGGYRGVLTVRGSIAQKYRGTVYRGPANPVNGNGYKKDYGYDENLRFVAPPKFLAPATTSYGVSQVAAVPAAFTSAGAKKT